MLLAHGYELREEVPSVPDYRRLRAAAGLSEHSEAAAAAGLPNSWASAVVRTAGGEVVGMARVIGDGGCFFQIVDMAVAPEHQRRGLGAAILTRLLERLRADGPAGAYVSLFADPPGRGLYRRHGFRESAPDQVGMALVLGPSTGPA